MVYNKINRKIQYIDTGDMGKIEINLRKVSTPQGKSQNVGKANEMLGPHKIRENENDSGIKTVLDRIDKLII